MSQGRSFRSTPVKDFPSQARTNAIAQYQKLTTVGSNNRPTTPSRRDATISPFSSPSILTNSFSQPNRTSADRKSTTQSQSSENVKVSVRVRSFLPRERGESEDLSVRMKNTTCELTLENKARHPFTFDQCFWSNDVLDGEMPFSGQEDVFAELGTPIVEHVLSGMNASIIAYGQTGSGKTYSLYGPPHATVETFGLIPRICNELFSRLEAEKTSFKATVSMVEIYMERVYDLFNQRQELHIRGDLRNGFHVLSAKRLEISDYQSILPLLSGAELQKTYASTAQNERSSRAHTLFELNVRTFGAKGTRISKLMLVDLAGSERIKASGAEGKVFEQACNINLSLMNLGRCIEAVVSSKHPDNHLVEFRHSALTKLLKESLGGNAKTMILATISPASADANNTLHALRFADRAKKIRNHAVINEYSLERQQLMSEEIKKVFEERMQVLKMEYELESKQQALLTRQIELEEQSILLDEERNVLARQKADYQQLSQKEKEALVQREQEINEIAKGINTELADMQCRRDDLEGKMNEVTAANTQILAEKKLADEEILNLQGVIAESQSVHRAALDDVFRRKMEEAETENRTEIERISTNALLELIQRRYATVMHNTSLLFKTELTAERRKHTNMLSEMEQRMKSSTEEWTRFRRNSDEKSRAYEIQVASLEEKLRNAEVKLERSEKKSKEVTELHASEVGTMRSLISSLTNSEMRLERTLNEKDQRTNIHQLVSSETIDRQETLLAEQHARCSLQFNEARIRALAKHEALQRTEVLRIEENHQHDIREQYFAQQKLIIYRKALSLTKCIRTDRT